MKKIADAIISAVLILILLFVITYRKSILTNIMRAYSTYNVYEKENEYTKGENYILFQRTNDFSPANKSELINVLYTILDDGMYNFTFYCEYDCNNDLKEISNEGYLDAMNNFVHPYNSYSKFNVTINSYNIVNVDVTKNYTEYEISMINAKIDAISKTIMNNNDDKTTKIRKFHDYVIKNTVYDKDGAELIKSNNTKQLSSHKAYTVLYSGKGVCGGYTDAMAIYLNYLGVKNFKISNDTHIWNAALLDNWYNIDLTWDDPIVENGHDTLIYDYFMITKNELSGKNDQKHSYNDEFYQELN